MVWNSLLLSFVFLTSFSAWSDCEDQSSTELDKKEMQEAKKVSGTKKYGEGFYYLFKIKNADFYLWLHSPGGMSGEPVFEGGIYKVEKDKVSFQCLDVFSIGDYKFSVAPDKKGIVVYEASGCNDHSPDDCKPAKRTYRYAWDGERFEGVRDPKTGKR